MATSTITGSFVASYDREYPYTGSTNVQHFGYSNKGHRAVTIFKLTMPSYNGTPTSLTVKPTVVRGSAYPTDKTSRWNVGLDSRDAGYNSTLGYCTGSAYADGVYTNTGAYTATFPSSGTATVTSTATTYSVNFSNLADAMFESGGTVYVYLYSDTGNHDMIKCNSLTAVLTYTQESSTTTTNTELRIGRSTSTTAPSTMSNSSATLTYNYNYLHYKISNLQYAVKEYNRFYIYEWDTIKSYFTQGIAWDTMTNRNNYIASTYNTTSTADNIGGYTTIPNSILKAANPTSKKIVAIAVMGDGRAWQIGGDSATSTPQQCTVSLTPANFIRANVSITLTSSTPTTATYSVKVGKNVNGFITQIGCKKDGTLTSINGSNTNPGTFDSTSAVATFSSSTSSQTKTLTITGLTPGATNTIVFNVKANTSYAQYGYYGIRREDLTTDNEPQPDGTYKGTCSNTLILPQKAILSASVDNLHNLDGYIYYTTSSLLPTSIPSTKIDMGTGYGGTAEVTVTSQTTYYFYVRSSVSKTFYKIGSTVVTPDAANYDGSFSASEIGSTTANFTLGSLSSTTNLNSNWYITTKHSAALVPGDSFDANIGSGPIGSVISGTNLEQGQTQTVYVYVYSSASGYYHLVDSKTITTSAPSYIGKVAVTGITENSATLCLFAIAPTVNMASEYYVTTTNYGPKATSISGTRADIKNSITLTNLVPGQKYTYYFYVKNTSDNNYYLTSEQVFETYSTLVSYQGLPHRVWFYNTNNSRWEAAVLKEGGSSGRYFDLDYHN